MSTRKTIILSLSIIIASFLIGIYFYPYMPEKIASHWDAYGNVNGYMPKFWGLFLMPMMSVMMFILFIIIPKIDPLKKNIAEFRKYFDGFIAMLMIFLFYLYLLTLFWSLNFRFNMVQALMPAFGILFYYCGILMENAKRNWFIGIRTPWTLSSETVWAKTHKLGAKLFKVSGVLALIGILAQDYAIYFVLVPALFASMYTVVYSYFEYKKETGK